MCTLTAFCVSNAQASSLIVTMNRDESLTRSEGEPILHKVSGQWQYWYPVDALAGGTWFAVHANGWVLALLNRYQDESENTVASGGTSRGLLIPALLKHTDYAAFKRHFLSLSLEGFAPCDLWCFRHGERLQISWNGRNQQRLAFYDSKPFLTVSSSTDIEEANAYRRQCFEALVEDKCVDDRWVAGNKAPDDTDRHNAEPTSTQQDSLTPEAIYSSLHTQPCNANPSLGFNMSRPGRHTKSICQAVLPSSAMPEFRYFTRDNNGLFTTAPYSQISYDND